MTQLTNVATALSQLCDGDVEYRSYSGRGMYGKKCAAITGSFQDCMAAISYLIQNMHTEVFDAAIDNLDGDETPYELDNEFAEAVDDLMRFQYDSMGTDVVVYWPHIEAVDHEG